MSQSNVNGVDLFYEITGQGDPLVLVHGSWGDHSNWQAVITSLAESFRVITYDRRGHSRSVRPGEGTRQDDENDLAALMEQLDIIPAHVAGNSFGASIALGLAARRPSLFRSLIVHEPPLMAIAAEDSTLLPVMTVFQKSIEKVIERLKAGDVPGGTRQFIEEVALGRGAWDGLPNEVRERFMYNALTWLNEQDDPRWASLERDALSAYSGPALLSVGDQSPPWFPAIMSKLKETMKQSKRHVFRGAGHVPHMSHPEDYVATIAEFIHVSP